MYLFVDRVSRKLVDVLNDFESVGAEEAMLVLENPTSDSILELPSTGRSGVKGAPFLASSGTRVTS